MKKNMKYALLTGFTTLMILQGCQVEGSLNEISVPSDELKGSFPSKEGGSNDKAVIRGKTNIANIKHVTKGEIAEPQYFPEQYSEIQGVLTFRGNHLRNSPSYGNPMINEATLEEIWSFSTATSPEWGGGAGWTGQPAIIHWEPEVRQMMNIYDEFKQKDLVEVIQASLDGNVYFFDLETGKQTRPHITNGNPIKGSVSVDSRGYPLLYVGEGIPEKESIGFNLYSLIDHTLLFHENGIDPFAYRGWGATDGSALFNRKHDTLLLGGENGLIYNYKLNTVFNKKAQTITIDPTVVKYRYAIDGNTGNPYQGIESSVAAYDDLLMFADNGGSLQALDLKTMEPLWALPQKDDTDSTPVVDIVGNTPFIFTGTEVDNIGKNGSSYLRKINGLNGKVMWEREYPAFYHKEVNGGVLATPVTGKQDINNLVIYTIARVEKMNAGLMLALNKETGEEVWSWEMPIYSWSSPIDIYTTEGKGYLLQGDAAGNLHLLDALDGTVLYKLGLGSNIESSPAIYEDIMVVPTRGGQIIGIQLK